MILQLFLLAPLVGLLAVLVAWHHPRLQAAIVVALGLIDLGLAAVLMGSSGLPPVAVGGWPAPYGIELAADGLSTLMLALTALVFLSASIYHLGQTLARKPATTNAVYHLTFPLLLLALNGLFLTTDFFNFYVFFELLAVASYLLVSLGKHAPLEAAWKYSAQSACGSFCLLVGTALLYGETGALGMAEVAFRLQGPALWAAPFFLAAFLLKGAVFPFHFWQPDAHAAATTAGSVLLAGLLIKVGLYAAVRFWPLLVGSELVVVFVGLGALSVIFGAVAAWRQGDAKRLLGFSSVSQVGFVLLALGWGTLAAQAAALFYLIHHSLTKGLLFVATGALSDRLGNTSLASLRGAGRAETAVGAAYLLGVFSLVGFPLTVGFVAKLALLQAAIGASAWIGLCVVIFGSFLTLAYGAKAFIWIFWEVPPVAPALAPLPWAHRLSVALLALSVVGAAIAAQPLYARCLATAAELEMRPAPGALGARRAP